VLDTRRLKLLMDRVTAGAGELVLGQQDHRQILEGSLIHELP
jgi:hypothetical protein